MKGINPDNQATKELGVQWGFEPRQSDSTAKVFAIFCSFIETVEMKPTLFPVLQMSYSQLSPMLKLF